MPTRPSVTEVAGESSRSAKGSNFNHRFLSALMDVMPDRIYFKDDQGRFLVVNKAVLKLHGRSEAEIVGKTDFDLFDREHAERADQDEAAVLATGKGMEGKEQKITLRDGRVFWVSTTKVPLRGDDGKPVGICGISRDITELHRQAEKLQEYADVLAEKQAQMEVELELAKQIQEALLPRHYPSFPPGVPKGQSALHLSHRYLPMGRVGGDYFKFLRLSPTKAGMLVCDVMGHGVPAALITSAMTILVDELEELTGDPGAFLTELNKGLRGIFQRIKTTLFATAFYVVVDAQDGEVSYASAAHPAPMLMPQTGAPRFLHPGAQGPRPLPLGMVADSEYATHGTRMEAGDRLLLFTDGLRDVGGEQGILGDGEFLSLVKTCEEGARERFLDRIVEAARGRTEGHAFEDDVCLVMIDLRRKLSGTATLSK